ncbi:MULTISPECIES: hypothetical protein [unclassified Amycolatopsis]|uniref:hypothetical protein n=1 Tax=unclassified Amycolatopsis TaxID=2618356 RepID=UPI001C69EE26|nr:hypothetical protein [Amycolatopsis sp. DSM 110486]QYN24902.1 hypothetical protein K1T34_22165 [Amycolatopsis sp. DSM 110486]
MPEGSHRADAEAMRAAKGALEAAAGRVSGVASQVVEADFGRGHGGAFAAYRNGFAALGDAVRAYAGELASFGSSVDVAAGRYASIEGEHVDTARNTAKR